MGELQYALQYERQADPTMDNPSGVVTNTMPMSSLDHAVACVRNGAPISGRNRRIVQRPMPEEWTPAMCTNLDCTLVLLHSGACNG